MPSVKTIERQIGNLESFDVTIRHPDGRDVRADRGGLPSYSYARGAKNTMNVSEWKQGRFLPAYPGFDCDVLDANGQPVHGNSLLGNVRETYLD